MSAPRCCFSPPGGWGPRTSSNLVGGGLETDHRGRLSVDRKTYQTQVPHIYAAGDVIGHPSLASTSMQQGRVAACHALDTPTIPESPWFPYGIYSVPEISTCGMSEEEMQERGIPTRWASRASARPAAGISWGWSTGC